VAPRLGSGEECGSLRSRGVLASFAAFETSRPPHAHGVIPSRLPGWPITRPLVAHQCSCTNPLIEKVRFVLLLICFCFCLFFLLYSHTRGSLVCSGRSRDGVFAGEMRVRQPSWRISADGRQFVFNIYATRYTLRRPTSPP